MRGFTSRRRIARRLSMASRLVDAWRAIARGRRDPEFMGDGCSPSFAARRPATLRRAIDAARPPGSQSSAQRRARDAASRRSPVAWRCISAGRLRNIGSRRRRLPSRAAVNMPACGLTRRCAPARLRGFAAATTQPAALGARAARVAPSDCSRRWAASPMLARRVFTTDGPLAQ